MVIFLKIGLLQLRILTGGATYFVFVVSNLSFVQYEPRSEKNRLFAYAKTNTQISFAVTAKLISVFVFAT